MAEKKKREDEPWIDLPIFKNYNAREMFGDPRIKVGPYVGPGLPDPSAASKGIAALKALAQQYNYTIKRGKPSAKTKAAKKRESRQPPMILETGLGLRPEEFQGPPMPVARLKSGRGGDVATIMDTGLSQRPDTGGIASVINPDTGRPMPSGPVDIGIPETAYRPQSLAPDRPIDVRSGAPAAVVVPGTGPSPEGPGGIRSVLMAYPPPNTVPGGTPLAPSPMPSVAAGTPFPSEAIIGPDRPMDNRALTPGTQIPADQAIPFPSIPGYDSAVKPWVEMGGDIYENILTPAGHFFRDIYNVPNPEGENAQPGNPMDPGAPTPVPYEDPASPEGTLSGTDVPPFARQPQPPKPPKIVTEVGTQRVPYSHFGPELPGAAVPDASTPPVDEPVAPEEPATDPYTLPPIPGTEGGDAGDATGALTLDDYIKKMEATYPDLDFQNNPKQALADANAARDLERTAMLAQLQVAAGMVSGAGKSWEGLGAGFANAGAQYDKGFTKYQNALQDSADRYAEQQEKTMTYDTARRKAALDLYSSDQTTRAENARTYWSKQQDRSWDITKLKVEGERAAAKQQHEDVIHLFDKEGEFLKPNEYNEPPTQAQIADYYARRDKGMRQGRYIAPGFDHDMTAGK